MMLKLYAVTRQADAKPERIALWECDDPSEACRLAVEALQFFDDVQCVVIEPGSSAATVPVRAA